MSWGDEVPLSEILGVTMASVEAVECNGEDEIHFTATDGRQWKMLHEQACCESVNLEDIDTSLDLLVGSPILGAEEASNSDEPPKNDDGCTDDSWTWTFYKLHTAKGHVTIRWYGTSNGYYSESVDFERVPTEEDN